MSGRVVRRAFVFALLAALNVAAQAADIVLVVADGAQRGFNDRTPVAPIGGNDGETLGAQRRIAFAHAAAILGSRIDSRVPIRIEASFDRALGCERNAATLGSAGPATYAANFQGAREADTFYPVALANALRGARLANTNNDIVGRFNARLDGDDDCLRGAGWYYGIDGATPAGQPSFVSTVAHELTHGLGFVSLVALMDAGADRAGQFPRAPSGARYPDIYSSRIQDLSFAGQPFWPELSDAQRRQSLTHGPNVVFAGASTVANGAPALSSGTNQGRVRIFAPDPVVRASSISHWDAVLAPDQIMAPFATGDDRVTRGQGLSTCVLQDIGWTLRNTRCPDNSGRVIAGAADDTNVSVEPLDTGRTDGAARARKGDGGSSGGGCTLAPGGRFDPLWLLLIAGAAATLRRRASR